MALQHLLHVERRVRLGGRRFGPWVVGGGSYTVGPTSVLRFVQFQDACGRLNEVGDLDSLATRLPAEVLRPLVPLWVTEPVKPSHLRRATREQIAGVFAAAGSVQDLDYVTQAMAPPAEGEQKEGVGLDVLLVTLARELHLGDPDQVLRWPIQKMFAVLDALRQAETPPAGGTPASPDEIAEARAAMAARGWDVS